MRGRLERLNFEFIGFGKAKFQGRQKLIRSIDIRYSLHGVFILIL